MRLCAMLNSAEAGAAVNRVLPTNKNKMRYTMLKLSLKALVCAVAVSVAGVAHAADSAPITVSYTHLTLPTIYSV